jgi:hypothetical protein
MVTIDMVAIHLLFDQLQQSSASRLVEAPVAIGSLGSIGNRSHVRIDYLRTADSFHVYNLPVPRAAQLSFCLVAGDVARDLDFGNLGS